MNISASHVLLQSKSSARSPTSAWRTASKFAPQTVQNFTSSVWFELHRGQVIDYHSFLVLKDTRSCMEMFFGIVLGAQASSPASLPTQPPCAGEDACAPSTKIQPTSCEYPSHFLRYAI